MDRELCRRSLSFTQTAHTWQLHCKASKSLYAGLALFFYMFFCHVWHMLGIICNIQRFTLFYFYSTLVFLLFWIFTACESMRWKKKRKKKHLKEWLKLNLFWHPHAAAISLPENRHCDNSIRNWESSIMDGQPCKWILFSGLWTKTELTESRLS